MEKLKIAAYVHGYLPNHNAGAENMLHEILLGLKEFGHEVKVITRSAAADEFEGIKIYDANDNRVNEILDWADIIFTHLDFTQRAMRLSAQRRKPLVHLVHNDKQLSYNKVTAQYAALAIANSEWIQKTIKGGIPSVVVYPPTDPDRYSVETSREAITLINLNEAKGGNVFWQLARIFPERKFIGVKGAYGEQIIYDKDLSNVTLYDNSPDVLPVYKQSRIVLMPSSYESWGRVAMEACCSGIPVIAAPTPGLKESLSYAGIFAGHTDIAGYVEAIRMLDNTETYDKHSSLAKNRAEEVTNAFKEQMLVLNKRLIEISKKQISRPTRR